MSVDLKAMNRKQLEKLSADVDKALSKRKKTELIAAKAAAEKAVKAFGFSLADLVDGTAPKAKRKTSAPKNPGFAKYANPNDKSQTWTGKGRRPQWFNDALAAGVTPDALEIKGAK